MKLTLVVILMALVSACVTPTYDQEVEATRDFVVANQLTETGSIRTYEQLQHRVLNDYFVTIETRRGNYLVEFRTRCSALSRRDFDEYMVDTRRDSARLSARGDTIRGCLISKIYEVTEQQSEELHQLGDAPGEEVFMPDEEEQAAEATDETDR